MKIYNFRYFLLVVFLVGIFGCEHSEKKILKYKPVSAQQTTKKERVEFCHTLVGNIESNFNYIVDEHRVYEVLSNTPYSFCSYIDDEIKIGQAHRSDINQCHTLTKAEVSRGARVTFVEHNPKYSTYKDGNIYWSCKYGSKPEYKEERKVNYVYKLYRYENDQDISLLRTDYHFYYYYRGTIFRRVGNNGKAEEFNTEVIKVSGKESFSNKVSIVTD
ncbi:hypothetical protein [Vibrio fluvialis]|uniref:hypothetical protein n=1 Tax=Vibrio fluvialis TaxID=676 RepID=UPI00192B7E8A|nr:hypothetical protein [Vibrio fluvialis]MBL4286363.1 hypothetical protein [Vibrio fluvialis]MBL4292906.1 hypothetical protein [Vibrio fluvialis]